MRILLNLIAQRVGIRYEDVAEWLRSQNSLGEIEDRILRGQYALVGLDDAAKQIATESTDSYYAAGKRTAEWLDSKIDDRLVRFDTAASPIVVRARQNELELVQGFQEERWQVARQITQRAVQESATLGRNPRRVAQDFRDSIGLTPQQEQWVANYRRALEQGEYTRATGYELSSGQADRTLRSYVDKEKQLTPAQIDDFVERYRANALNYRAETIARTEALRNANQGVQDSIDQAVKRGDVEPAMLSKEWHAGPATDDSRDMHQAMDGVQVPFGEDFVLPDGTRMSGPGDPRGGAKHNANCRCTSSVALA